MQTCVQITGREKEKSVKEVERFTIKNVHVARFNSRREYLLSWYVCFDWFLITIVYFSGFLQTISFLLLSKRSIFEYTCTFISQNTSLSTLEY